MTYRIKIITSTYPALIGQRACLTGDKFNNGIHNVYSTDIPHPDDSNTFLWLNETEFEYLNS